MRLYYNKSRISGVTFPSKSAIITTDGSVAQLVEQRPEEPCVDGSSPPGTTRRDISKFDEVFYLRFTEVGDLFLFANS